MLVDHTLAPGPLDGVVAEADLAVELGFDGVFSAETSHDPFLPLALVGGRHPGLTLGTAIAVAFPRSPMVVAQTARDLSDLSGGNFILGLGTQVKPHIVRRFSTEWSAPVPRLREYITALRAIWAAFDEQAPLRFSGEHYSFSLLTPFFSPGPGRHGPVPVAIAGVGPALSRLAGEMCDGFHIHPFHTVRYLDQVVLPNLAAGAESAGRRVSDVTRMVSVFVVTGADDLQMARARAVVKRQIAFYASTPSYRVILDTHGWDFGDELNRMSRQGRWDEMGAVIPDEVVDLVAVVAEPDRIGEAIRARYGERIQRVGFYNVRAGVDLGTETVARAVDRLHG